MYSQQAKQDALDLWFSMLGEISVADFVAEQFKSRFCDQKTRFFCHCASMGRSVAWALRRVNGLQVPKLGRCTKS